MKWAMIAVLILVVAYFAAPVLFPRQMQRFQCKGQQSEGKSQLKGLHSRFDKEVVKALTHDPSGFSMAPGRYYRYSLVSAMAPAFTIKAEGFEGMVKGDVWTIDEKGSLQNVTNACAAR